MTNSQKIFLRFQKSVFRNEPHDLMDALDEFFGSVPDAPDDHPFREQPISNLMGKLCEMINWAPQMSFVDSLKVLSEFFCAPPPPFNCPPWPEEVCR